MLWLPLLAIALVVIVVRRWVQIRDEGTVLSIYSVGVLSFCWGFVISPTPIQVCLELLALGWFSRYRWTYRER